VHVTAVVVNWNGADHLDGCLRSLLAQDHSDFDVLVVDNASTDGSAAILARWESESPTATPVRVLRNQTNRGFAGAVNDALAETDAGAVLVCNPDARPMPTFVSTALAALLADDRRGAVQGKLLRTDRAPSGEAVIDTTGHVGFRARLFRNRGEGQIDRGQWERPGEVFGVSGALALYRRTMLDDVAIEVDGRREVFDEDLFAFWEDVDLDWRAAMRGWVCWYEPAALAEHERGGAGPRRTARVEQLNWQNRLLVLVKNDTFGGLLRALPGLLVTTTLKTGELLLTVPSAFVAALRDVRLVGVMRRKRAAVHERATVPSRQVVNRWFEPFDYGNWVATWWRRVRGIPVGREP
jgi:GT2 family glycosyltransferase